MCLFDDDNELSKLKPKAISLWYEHQSVLGDHAKVQAERDALAARVKELEAQLAQEQGAVRADLRAIEEGSGERRARTVAGLTRESPGKAQAEGPRSSRATEAARRARRAPTRRRRAHL